MKHFLTTLFMALSATLIYAQTSSIVVEKVAIKETIDNSAISEIPRLRDKSNPNNAAVAAINMEILDVFSIESFEQNEITDFRWYEVTFESEVKDGIVFISYKGEYVGAYPNYVEEELYFDLTTGKRAPATDVPFQALFTLQGYLEFLNRYWLNDAKAEFKKAVECAGGEGPFCSYYDIDKFSLQGNKLLLKLQQDCYPHVIMNCAPTLSKTLAIDSIKPYLNSLGMRLLLADRYTEKTGVDKLLYGRKVANDISNQVFMFGLIDGKYAISMALNFDKNTTVNGYYYYDRRRQKITLKGTYQSSSMDLEETVDGKTTGRFHFRWSEAYDENAFTLFAGEKLIYLKGTWSNADNTKTMVVKGKEIKVTKGEFWVGR